MIEAGPEDIDKTFYNEHKNIFQYKRGNGLWLWKPYIIKRALANMQDGSILFYCDSGACFFRRITPVLKILQQQDIWITTTPLIEEQFTSKAAFEALGLTDKKYKQTSQMQGSFLALRKNSRTIKFVDEWLSDCCILSAIMPVEDTKDEIKGFIAHREDQSILSLLVKKHNIRYYSDPTQFGRLPEKYRGNGRKMQYYGKEDYSPFILLHRTKDGNKNVLLRQWLCAILPRKIGLTLIK